mgnify:CR=1 FL=1
MHVEAWGLNHSLYLPYVMHGRPSVAASFSLRPQDSLWDGAHHARLTGDVVDEILGGKVDRADWSVAPDDPGTGARPRHKLSLPYRPLSSCQIAQVFKDDATRPRRISKIVCRFQQIANHALHLRPVVSDVFHALARPIKFLSRSCAK